MAGSDPPAALGQASWRKLLGDLPVYDVVNRHGDGPMIRTFARCGADRRYTAADVRDLLREAA